MKATQNSLLAKGGQTLALTLALAFAQGCSKDDAGPLPHLGARSLEVAASAPPEEKKLKALAADPSLASVAMAYQSRFAMAKELDNESITTERLAQVASSLAPSILNKDNVRNPRLQGDDAFTTSLGFFNDSILKLSKRDEKALAATGILKSYEAFLYENCPDSLSNCRNLPFFASDANSAAVLLLIAGDAEREIERTRADKGQAYAEAGRRLLKIYRTIYSVFNSSFNNDYYLRYVKYNADVSNYISTLTSRERKERDHDLRLHQQFLNTALVLLKAEKNVKSRAAYCDFVIEQKPFAYSMSNPAAGTAGNIRQIISQFIECATERNVLDSQIRAYLVDEKAKQSTASIDDPAVIKDFSYYYALNYLKRTPEILENLSIKDDERGDLAFFVIDRLFYQAIDQKLATEYWKQIKNIDDLVLLDFVDNYVKVQTAYTLKATHAIVAKVIATEYAKEGLSGDLYTRIVDKVNQGTQFEWETLKTRVGFLRNFLVPIFDERITRVGLGEKTEAEKKYAGLKDRLESLSEHLNYVATSPIMLSLSYYMSKAPGQIKIFISWWQGTNQWMNIDGTDSLRNFFEKQKNWIRFFKYGTQDFSFDEYQLKHVFDYALRTGLFDTIPFGVMAEDKPNMKIAGGDTLNGEWLFFRQLIEARLRRNISGAQRKIDDLERALTNQEFVDRFNGFCDDPLAAPIRLSLSQLTSSPLLNDDALKSGVGEVYSTRGQFNILVQDRAQVEDLRQILVQHFFGEGAEKRLSKEKLAKRDEILGLIDGELEKFYKSERDLFRRMLAADASLYSANRNCFLRLHKAEMFRTNTLYRENVAVYKDIHAAITLMRLLPETLKLEDLAESERTAPNAALQRLSAKVIAEWQNSDDAKAMGPVAADVAARMLKNAQVSFHNDVWKSLAAVPGSEFKEQTLATQAALALSGRFQPQNVRPVFVAIGDEVEEYGIFVDGLETYERSKVLFLAKSELTRKGLRHGKRDTLLRLRRQLQLKRVDAKEAAAYIGLPANTSGKIPLAGGLEIPIGTFAELANDSLFTNNDLAMANWVSDQTAFVRDAMTHFAGEGRGGNQFVSWHSSPDTYGLKYLRERLGFLKELSNAGPRDISQAEKRLCKINAWFEPIVGSAENCKIFKVSIESLLHSTMEILNLYRVTPEEREILSWIGREGRFHDRALSHFYLNDKDDAADWTYFDRYYKLNFVGQEATRADGKPLVVDRVDGSGAIEEFMDSTRLRIYPEKQLFPMREYVTQFIRNRLRRPIVKQIERATEFEELIRDIEDKKVELGDFVFQKVKNVRTDSRYFDGDWRFVGANIRAEGERAGTPIYLRDDQDSAQSWFRKVIMGFIVTETKCDTLPRAGDPDFEQLPEEARKEMSSIADCRERHLAWQRALDAERAKARQQRRAAR